MTDPPPQQEPPNDKPRKSWFSAEDKALLRKIGNNIRRIINGEEVVDISTRTDDLGILANMVNRVGKELKESRERDQQQRKALEQTIQELEVKEAALQQSIAQLQRAQESRAQLMSTVKELSTPILNLHEGIMLLPIIGLMDDERAQVMLDTLLQRVATSSSQVLILDITGMPVVDTQVANVMLQAAQAVKLLGATTILCGMTPDVAQVVVNLGIQLETLRPCSDLQVALDLAFRIIGRSLSRR